MSTVAAPVVGSPLPLASLAMTLITQVAREGTAGFWIASGGPKTQFSTGWHAPAVPPQFASDVQLGCGAFALTQCFVVALDPWVQSSLPVPLLAMSVLPGPTSR